MTKHNEVSITPTTADDVREFYQVAIPWRIRALTVRVNGEIKGIGGYAILPDGNKVAFVEASEADCKRYRFALTRAVRRFFREVSDNGVRRLIACGVTFREASPRWLERLGFEMSGVIEGQTIYLWHMPRQTNSVNQPCHN